MSQGNSKRLRLEDMLIIPALMFAAVALSACDEVDSIGPGNPDPNAAAEVLISSTTGSVAVGETTQLKATVRDAQGDTLSGYTIDWSSSDASVASVDETGMLTGVAAGEASITARAGEASGALNVVVRASGGAAVAECEVGGAAWIWCDDFELDRLADYFEYNNPSGDEGLVRMEGVGLEGSTGMRARFATGQVQAGSLHLAFGRTPGSYFRPVDEGVADYREVYWRLYLKNQPGWTGGGGAKLSRATVFAGSDWTQALMAHVWSGSREETRDYLLIDPASGTDEEGNLQTTKYNDFDNFRWLGLVQGRTPLFDDEHVGRWYCIEAHVRLNDAGQANGMFELWIDGTLEASKTDMNWLGLYSEYGINAVFFENYWNSGSPQTQDRYFDNIVVSTELIGC